MLINPLRRNLHDILYTSRRCLRDRSRILDDYATFYRTEVQSELEHLAVQTARKKSLQINYELEQQRKRQQVIRYHVLRRKYVAHPNDIQIDPYVKNHMQFLYKNYPKRWNVQMLAESFNQSVENVRLILQQRTKRGMRVRTRPPSSLCGVKEEDEADKIMREHLIKRDLISHRKSTLSDDEDGDPVDHQILAEESHLVSRQRPSNSYLQRDNDGFFSNVIEKEEEENDQEKRAITPPETLLDRINKLRINPTKTFEDPGVDLSENRLKILEKMRQSNDHLAEISERKEKYVKK